MEIGVGTTYWGMLLLYAWVASGVPPIATRSICSKNLNITALSLQELRPLQCLSPPHSSGVSSWLTDQCVSPPCTTCWLPAHTVSPLQRAAALTMQTSPSARHRACWTATLSGHDCPHIHHSLPQLLTHPWGSIVTSYWLGKISLLYFFHFHFVPLYSPPPGNHHMLSMSMSPFSFLLNPSTP